jgi:tRNA threonylcarbamoyladenosine biosynthesis protein TsaB
LVKPVLLAIDTATRTASLALYSSEGVLAETTWRSRENHTVELTPQIVRLLELAGVQKNQLTVIAIALGPGSFTGLRVGMSVAKGLAFGSQIPLIGVPTLDAMAHAHVWQALPIWVVLAAGRGRYSVARYSARRGAAKRVGDYALVDSAGLVDLACQVEERSKTVRAFFCGDVDAGLAQLLGEGLGTNVVFASPASNTRRAAFLAELAWARHLRGESDDTGSLTPLYMPHESVEGSKP